MSPERSPSLHWRRMSSPASVKARDERGRAIEWELPLPGCGLNPTAPGGALHPEVSQRRKATNPHPVSLAQAIEKVKKELA